MPRGEGRPRPAPPPPAVGVRGLAGKGREHERERACRARLGGPGLCSGSARCGCSQRACSPSTSVSSPSSSAANLRTFGRTRSNAHLWALLVGVYQTPRPGRPSADPRASLLHGCASVCGVPALQAGPLGTKAPEGLRPLLPFLRWQIQALTLLADSLYRRPNLLLLLLAAPPDPGGQFLLLT